MRLVGCGRVGGVWVAGHCSELLMALVPFSSSWAGGSLVLQDLSEICDKRDVWKKSFQQAADERDLLQVEVVQLKRRLAEQDSSSSSKKEATTLRKVCVCWLCDGAGQPMRGVAFLCSPLPLCSNCKSPRSTSLSSRIR